MPELRNGAIVLVLLVHIVEFICQRRPAPWRIYVTVTCLQRAPPSPGMTSRVRQRAALLTISTSSFVTSPTRPTSSRGTHVTWLYISTYYKRTRRTAWQYATSTRVGRVRGHVSTASRRSRQVRVTWRRSRKLYYANAYYIRKKMFVLC